MVKKVAVPALSSVVKVEFRSLSLNRLPTRLLATSEFSRVKGEGFELGGGVSISMI